MSRNVPLSAVLLTACTCVCAAAPTGAQLTTAQLAERYNQLPLRFVPNQGQADPAVLFLSRGQGQSVFLTKSGAVLAFHSAKPGKRLSRHTAGVEPTSPRELPATETAYVELKPITAHSAARIQGDQPQPGVTNYFQGSDSAAWRSGLPAFARVRYAEVYPGIDLVYHSKASRFEFDFVVRPGSDPGKIAMRIGPVPSAFPAIQGALQLDREGRLTLPGAGETMQLEKPFAYQGTGPSRTPVDVAFELAGPHKVRFRLGSTTTASP